MLAGGRVAALIAFECICRGLRRLLWAELTASDHVQPGRCFLASKQFVLCDLAEPPRLHYIRSQKGKCSLRLIEGESQYLPRSASIYEVMNHIHKPIPCASHSQNRTQLTPAGQVWGGSGRGKTPLRGETLSRPPRLWRATICFERLGWKGNINGTKPARRESQWKYGWRSSNVLLNIYIIYIYIIHT